MLRLDLAETLEHIAPTVDTAVGCRNPSSAEAEEGLERGHWLFPAVVPKDELIKVRLELSSADAVVGPNQPVLEVANNPVREWYDRGGALTERRAQRLLDRDVPIPGRLQSGECPEAVAIERRASGHILSNDGAHGGRCEIRQHEQADATRVVVTPLDRDHDGDCPTIFELTASFEACLRCADPGVIEFDFTVQRLSGGIDHGSTQFVEHQPGGFIAAQPKLTLDEERRDAALVRCHQIGGPEPLDKRRLGVVENRTGRQRNLMPTRRALPASVRDHVGSTMTATRTHEALRPATGFQILLAGLFSGKLAAELVQILRKWRAPRTPTLQIVAG